MGNDQPQSGANRPQGQRPPQGNVPRPKGPPPPGVVNIHNQPGGQAPPQASSVQGGPAAPAPPASQQPSPAAQQQGGAGAAAKAGALAEGDRTSPSGAVLSSTMSVADFELLKVVGKGSFGKVMQVKHKATGKIYAMKVLKKQHLVARKQVAHTQTERKVLENISHPFIVSLRYAFQTPEKLYMILDFFNGGELFFHLKNTGRFPEARARFYAAEILSAIECLHSHGIIYRDLKPENVLLDENGHIRLTDFGLSKESIDGDAVTHTFCGTPEYLAPEVIHGTGYGRAVDWWSLGTLLYEMLTGLPPFYNENLHVMYQKIISAKLTFPEYLSAEAKAVLTGLLQRDPKRRLGSNGDAEEIRKHPFFLPIDFDALNRREIQPPYKPPVSDGKMDLTNVDEEFKSETVKDTPAPAASKIQQPVNFPNFTYVAPKGTVLQDSLLDDKNGKAGEKATDSGSDSEA